MTNKITYLTLILFCATAISAFAQSERKYIRSGNELYNKAIDTSLNVDSSLMQKAEVEYRKAIENKPSTFEGRYDLGNSLYRQKKYDEALKEWQSLTGLNLDNKKKGQLYHNIGNANLISNKLKESIEAYKNALRNYPDDINTKYNLAFAQSKLKEQQKKQQNQNQDQNKKDQQNKDKQKQNQQQKQDQQKQNQQQQDQQKQQAKDQQAKQDQGKEQKDQQQQGKEGEKISKKDAERILQALQIDEKQLQEKLKKLKAKNQNRKKTDKDW